MQSTLVFSYLIFHTNFVRYLQNTNRHFFYSLLQFVLFSKTCNRGDNKERRNNKHELKSSRPREHKEVRLNGCLSNTTKNNKE